MIWESHYWKRELLKIANDLSRRSEQKRWPEISLVRVEQNIMLGFYVVRKLVEARKVSNKTATQIIRVPAHRWKGTKSVTLMNWHKIDQLYDQTKTRHRKLRVSFIYNQFIHSYVFILCFKDNCRGLDGVFVSSDNERHKFIYFVTIAQIIKLFKQVGEDYPNDVQMIYNPKKRDYDVRAITHRS